MSAFEPRLVGLLCEHCAYVAADRAGAARIPFPPEVRLVRVPCSGRVDAAHVLHALSSGADGVVVIGCHPGDCHFEEQNLRALQRRHVLARVLEAAGISRERHRLAFVSAGEPQRLADELSAAVEAVRALGPLGHAAGPFDEDDAMRRDGESINSCAPRHDGSGSLSTTTDRTDDASASREASSAHPAVSSRAMTESNHEGPQVASPSEARTSPRALGGADALGLDVARVRQVLELGERAAGTTLELELAGAEAPRALHADVCVEGVVRARVVAPIAGLEADASRLAASLRLVASLLEADARAATASDAPGAVLAQALIDSFSGPLCFKDNDGRYLGCNAAFQALVGKPRLDVVGRTAADLFPHAVAALDALRDAEVRDVDGARIAEESLVGADGGLRHYLVDRAVLLTPSCAIAGVITAMTDITERRHAERMIAESQQRLLQIVEHTPLAVIEWDAEFRVMVWNRAAERIFGWSEADVVGLHVADLIVPPAERVIVNQVWTELIAQRGGTRSQNRNIRRDGRELVCEWYNVPLLDDHGVTVGAVSMVEDVTEQLAAQAALRAQEEQLRHAQKMEAVGRLAGGVAHDFNNILLVINSTAEICLTEMPMDAPLRQDLETILQAGDRGASITQQLLAFSRKQVLTPTMVNLNRVVEEIRQLLTRLIGEHITVRATLAPDLWPVRIDRAQLDQVLINLAVNARDAMPEGGMLAIATHNFRLVEPYRGANLELCPGEYVVLEVSDTGHGMSDDVRARIFEPFFTTKPAGQGTGLGLATVYGIVEQSGGQLEVRTAPERGATFRIYLPRGSELHSSAPPAPRRAARSRADEVVLLVEDDAAVRQLTRGILARAGYQVLMAHDGAAALALLGASNVRIDGMLTDVIMPGMSGGQLVREALTLRPGLPYLFMSGYTGELLQQAGLSDAAAILYKPFKPDQLTSRMREVLDSRADTADSARGTPGEGGAP